MDPYRSEEEQIKALRQWWERNGASTLIGVGLAIAIVFGWQWWQQREASRAEQAAVLFQQLLQATELAAGDEVQRATAEHLAQQLLEDQKGRRYGDYAALMLARLKVQQNELEAAEAGLRAVVDDPSDAHLGELARVRLARVLVAQDRLDEALALVEQSATPDFAAERAELRGDILRAGGDVAGALAAYRQAAQAPAGAQGAASSRILELKIAELEVRAQNVPARPGAQAAHDASAEDSGPDGAGDGDAGQGAD